MGCLFALIIMLSPRFGIVLLWAFTNIVGRVYNGWFVPLLGLLFAPWTTLFYMMVASTGQVNLGGWIFVGIGLLMDMANYSQSYVYRAQVPYSSRSKG
mgnify:CR=1 FL=1